MEQAGFKKISMLTAKSANVLALLFERCESDRKILQTVLGKVFLGLFDLRIKQSLKFLGKQTFVN